MAEQKAEATRFYEIVMEGKPRLVRAFLAGLCVGLDRDFPVWFNHEAGVHHEGFAEKLAESAHLRPKDTHFICGADLRDLIKQNEKRILQGGGLRVLNARTIRSARLEFKFTAYAKVYGEEIKALLSALPDGLKIKQKKCEEKVNPEAEGIEGRASAHDYEFYGQGEITGPIDLVLQMRGRLEEQPLIQMKKIKLTLA